MPLPQATAPHKYILKNFNYFEEMTFSAIAGPVPNRGGNYQQDGYVLSTSSGSSSAKGPPRRR